MAEPTAIIDAIKRYDEMVSGFEIASLQVHFNTVAVEDAEKSMRLFSEEVMTKL